MFYFSSIYHLIEEREHLWNKMIMMQEQANDPARLWQNRGGQLLKEEKERKVIQKVNFISINIHFFFFTNTQLLYYYF